MVLGRLHCPLQLRAIESSSAVEAHRSSILSHRCALSPLGRALSRRPIYSSCVPKSNLRRRRRRRSVRQRCNCVGRPLPLKHCSLSAKPKTQMADRRATVANPFADIIQTAQKAPRPDAPLRPANAARKAVKKATKTPARSPIRRRDDKDEAALRKEVARLKRENFSLAARLNARAAAPPPAQDDAPPPPPPAPKTGRRYSVSTTRFSLDSRLPAARRASFALVQPTSKPPPLIEEATPCLEFVAVYGAFDAHGEGAAGSSSIKGAYAARPRELFGRGDLAVNARRALPAFCCPDGVPCLCGNQPVSRVRCKTHTATPSSRRRVDGVEVGATIQYDRTVKF